MSVRVRNLVILGVLCFFYFLLFLGDGIFGLTNPDEVFYSCTAKEMAVHQSWMTPYLFDQPQFEKPILLYWLLRIGRLVWGDSAFAYRFFPAVFAALGVFGVYWLGRTIFGSEKKALMASLVLMSASLYVAMGRTVFTDMIFTVFIALSLAAFFQAFVNPAIRWGIPLSGLFAGLAVLTKGPLGFAIPAATVLVFLALRGQLKFLVRRDTLWGILVLLLVAGPWYGWIIWKYGTGFTHEFFYNDHWRRLIEAEHKSNDHWFFYPMSILGGMAPWCVYAGGALVVALKNFRREQNPGRTFLLAWVFVTFVVFQVAHSKLASYVLPLFPALALLCADFFSSLQEGTSGSRRPAKTFAIATLGLFVLAIVGGVVFGTAHAKGQGHSAVTITKGIKTVLGLAGAVVILLTALHCWFVGRGRLWGATASLVLIPACVLGFAFLLRQPIGDAFSSKAACEYLMEQYRPQGTLLCSKRLVRSVRFFTGHEVAIAALGKGDFFSPHPLPHLTTKEEFAKFLGHSTSVYAVLDTDDASKLKKAVGAEYGVESLKKIGSTDLVRIGWLQTTLDAKPIQ
jgi:4-amino-4-deoxy-L-arabinose transferase-like glycosyltransferase